MPFVAPIAGPLAFCIAVTFFVGVNQHAVCAEDVAMANGIKIGEVDSDSAIVWTRLTANPQRNTEGEEFVAYAKPKEQPEYEDLGPMQGSVLGKAGEVRVKWWPTGDEASAGTTDWQKVGPEHDFIHQFPLEGLGAATRYKLRVEGRGEGESLASVHVDGKFLTAPAMDQSHDVQFVVTTCGEYPKRDDPENGHRIYPAMQAIAPDFFVHTGDIEYYDRAAPFAKNLELARFKWNRLYAMPFLRDFHNQTSSYFMKDDHDTTRDDAWPGKGFASLTWEQGLATFREQVPMGEKTYRTVRWGKDLQIWMVEGRDFRSPNTMPDGPGKSIWGETQKQWFFDTVNASDATFRVLISPTPMVGPDRKRKNDNHANAGFTHEGDLLRSFISKQTNMYVVCGDRHWQYATIDPNTGLREFSCGPASDNHAQGYSEEKRNDMHRFLRIKGGFLSVRVDSKSQKISFRHHRVDGTVRNEESFDAFPSLRHD